MLDLLALGASGATVHVYQQTDVGGTMTRIGDTTVAAGTVQTSVRAPAIGGAIFTHWSISEGHQIAARDVFGRANDVATFAAFDVATLTAHYLPETLDSDADGVADGHELYWYGNLDQTAESDTDGDGYGLAVEIAAGTSPVLPDFTIDGGVLCEVGEEELYNPKKLSPYILRCEPEGVLFATSTNYLNVGESVVLPTMDRQTTTFACWKINGVRQADALGRAEEKVSFPMPNCQVECVAVCETDPFVREQLYWYGNADVAADSDTDQDGFTFAQEIAAGTNPLYYDYTIDGGVLKSESPLTLYNAKVQSPYIVRSEPEGVLFKTETNYVIVGTTVDLPVCTGASFAYWTVDGAPQRDVFGRATEGASFKMPNHTVECVAVSVADETERAKLYWYGRNDVDLSADTDGDGFSFAQELAAGTNPHMVDYTIDGGVLSSVSEFSELDLQKYEQVLGCVVDGQYREVFTSPLLGNGATCETFFDGAAIRPVVVDLNDDGLFDLVIEKVEGEGKLVYLNCGSRANPEFGSVAWQAGWAQKLEDARPVPLAELMLATVPDPALSHSFAGTDLLVSDETGRIWYYRGPEYKLQHKVWGGTHVGFAEGLRIAAVDWEDDGDWDCLCGTANGKLILLRNPGVGRPTDLRASVGVDNALLEWDENQQSRVRGYKVYRAPVVESGDEPAFENLTDPHVALPTYRDYPKEIADYDYKVTAVSRYYTAGNSSPTINESVATDPVRVSLGQVALHWTDVTVQRGVTFSLMLSVENSASLSSEGLAVEIEYDHQVLNLLKTVPSGLFESGKIAAGSGKLYEYVFEIVAEDKTSAIETEICVKRAEMSSIGGLPVSVVLPERNAKVMITAAQESAAYQLGDLDGDGLLTVEDVRLLAKVMNAAGRKYTADQLRAGDYNGNGRLDQDDYKLLRDDFKKRGILGGGGKK